MTFVSLSRRASAGKTASPPSGVRVAVSQILSGLSRNTRLLLAGYDAWIRDDCDAWLKLLTPTLGEAYGTNATQPRVVVHRVGIRPDRAHRAAPAAARFAAHKTRWTQTATPDIRATWPAQLELALDNLETVLADAAMTLANVVRLNLHTTDVDELFTHFPTVNDRFGNSRYATTVLGVAQLPARLLVMLKATVVD